MPKAQEISCVNTQLVISPHIVINLPSLNLLHFYCTLFCREDSFPRLGSMIVEYESPLKKIAEQFVPHQQVRY